eukprot:TRINITY_DN1733_c0_g1_i8.p1 TRINITY_DN1733_c0_g1~~TRINITY_DN1733_c0_g1_i8.p1  ORF type:complete len:160 (-),score=36.58 TRINITY_DN1733_c0_g1_i8:131-550(-)
MSAILVLVFIATCASGIVADAVSYRPFAGLEREIEMDSSVQSALAQLNRYHGSGSYSYHPSYHGSSYHHGSSSYYRPSYNQGSYYRPSYSQPSYYRPTYNQPSNNLGNILTPVVFGLAAATGVAAATSLFPSTAIVRGN